MIKRLLPVVIKRFLWFVFKAPQRKWIGYSSLYLDIKAWLRVWLKRRTYHRITVCVGVKDRSENLLRLIDSVHHCNFKPLIDLSVFDCGSSDVPDLLQAIKQRWRGRLIYQRMEMPFARSTAFNGAVKGAETKYILVCDADMTLPTDIVKQVSAYAGPGSAWFPIVWYTNQDGSGRYYQESTGMLGCLKSEFEAVGGYDESIRQWGKEDWLLFFEFYKHGIACLRTRERGFVHHWHPSLKPADFTPLF